MDLVGGASKSHNSPRAGMKSGRADLALLARELPRTVSEIVLRCSIPMQWFGACEL